MGYSTLSRALLPLCADAQHLYTLAYWYIIILLYNIVLLYACTLEYVILSVPGASSRGINPNPNPAQRAHCRRHTTTQTMDHATATNNVLIDVTRAPVYVVTINRAHVRNAVDRPTARALHAAFVAFANDDRVRRLSFVARSCN